MNINKTANHSIVIESVTSAHCPEILQANDPGSLLLHNQYMNLSNKPLLQPATDDPDKVVVMENPEDNQQQDWIAEPDISEQSFVKSEFQQLLTLNEELRQANSDLYTQVEKLKTELAEAEKILQWQKTRSSVSESMFSQQTQELSAAQEQIQLLYQQLDVSVQTVQRQEIIIENYKSHVQISQQRLAILERECSLLQSNYSEESQQLIHSENTCRELRTRLMRQQRQTLQFKAALEKCLDKPVFNEEITEDPFAAIHHTNYKETRFSRKAHSLLNNVQPIQPWSADLEEVVSGSEDNETSEIPIYQDLTGENLPRVNLPDNLVEEVVTTLSQTEELPSSANSCDSDINFEEIIEDYWLDSPPHQEEDLLNHQVLPDSSDDDLSEQKSPSPLIYPQRPPKGRKSLASVELPNFRPKTE